MLSNSVGCHHPTYPRLRMQVYSPDFSLCLPVDASARQSELYPEPSQNFDPRKQGGPCHRDTCGGLGSLHVA